MRRTTISRFKGAGALTAAALLAAAGPLAAQDTTVVQVPQQRVHMVTVGETLWTLAELYLGDPYLWPEIYRINTLVVEDPHWIFPGEELRLVPPDTVLLVDPNQQLAVGDSVLIPVADSVEQADSLALPMVADPELQNQVTEAPPPPPPPPATQGRTVLNQRGEARRSGLTVVRQPPTPRTGRLRYHSSGYLTEGENLPWAEVLGAVGQTTLSTLTATSMAWIHERISIEAPNNATYHVGDSLVLSQLTRQVAGWGRIVVPTGIARVVQVSGRDVEAEIEMQFGRVADGQVALPIEPFRGRAGDPVPIANGMRGSIIEIRDLHPVATLWEIVFIDRGRDDGIVSGDEFEVIIEEQGSDFPARQLATLEVVHVRQRSASAMVTGLTGVGIRPGVTVRLIRKMS